MSSNSRIEWTETTWKPVVGCTKVSPGCANCYAETMSKRLAGMARADMAKGNNPGRKAHYSLVVRPGGHWNNKVQTVPEALADPLKWRKPRRVFVNSMSDLFHEDVPFEFVDRVFAVMALTPRHTYQVLTKRPERMAEYMATLKAAGDTGDIAEHLGYCAPSMQFSNQDGIVDMTPGEVLRDEMHWPLPNVHLGTSVENQATADERMPHLLRCPAAVRFLSMEPLLGAVDLSAYFGGEYVGLPGDVVHANYNHGIHWFIVGGESGPGARPMHPDWARSIRDQCAAAGVPFFFKQWGAWVPSDQHGPYVGPGLEPHQVRWINDDGTMPMVGDLGLRTERPGRMHRLGKKSAGRLLDSVEHNAMPEVQDAD